MEVVLCNSGHQGQVSEAGLDELQLGVHVCPQGEGGEGRRVMAEALPLLEIRGAEASDDGEGPEG